MTLSCNDKGIRKYEFVAKTQFLYLKINKTNEILRTVEEGGMFKEEYLSYS